MLATLADAPLTGRTLVYEPSTTASAPSSR